MYTITHFIFLPKHSLNNSVGVLCKALDRKKFNLPHDKLNDTETESQLQNNLITFLESKIIVVVSKKLAFIMNLFKNSK